VIVPLEPVPEDWSRALAVVAHPDGLVEPSIALRRDLAAAIRRHRPEVLVSIHFGERWPSGLNHADHRAVGSRPCASTRCTSSTSPKAPVGKDPDSFLRGTAAATGEQCGVAYVTTFELVAL
jgi:hypothetical protein